MMANAAGGKHRPSFKMVSNMVIQLLHSIKYSVEVPFSNMAPQPPEIQKSQAKAKVSRAEGQQSLCIVPPELTLKSPLNRSPSSLLLLFYSSLFFPPTPSKLSNSSAADWTL